MAGIKMTNKTRVLHAALQLPAFTVKQLGEVSGLQEGTVAGIVQRAKEYLVEAGRLENKKRGPPQTIYRLREEARKELAGEAVELADMFRDPSSSLNAEEIARRAGVLLNAAEATIERGQLPADDEDRDESWREHANDDLTAARQILRSISEEALRAPIISRLEELTSRIEKAPSRKEDWLDQWRQVSAQYQPGAILMGVSAGSHQIAAAAQIGMSEPAILFGTIEEELTPRVARQLQNTQHLVLRLEMQKLLPRFQEQTGRSRLLEALKASVDPVVYMTMNSAVEESQKIVGSLLKFLNEYVWKKTAKQPEFSFDLVMIDTDIDPQWLRLSKTSRNVTYASNVRSTSSIDRALEGLIYIPELAERDPFTSFSRTAVVSYATKRTIYNEG